MSVKVDIRKAFDTMGWNFLLLVLKTFGFHPVFCDWIRAILHSARLSVLVNGSIVGVFPCKRRVRQGDPLSPLLFCLAEEMLVERLSWSVFPVLCSLCRIVGVSLYQHIFFMQMIFLFVVQYSQKYSVPFAGVQLLF